MGTRRDLLSALPVSLFSGCVGVSNVRRSVLENDPYADVEWATADRIKTGQHIHPSKMGPPRECVEHALAAGMRFIWLGDRGDDPVYWPPDGIWGHSPAERGFIADAGVEARTSMGGTDTDDPNDHIITMYSNLHAPDDFEKDHRDVIGSVTADGGLCYFAHHGAWDEEQNPSEHYKALFEEWRPSDGLLGFTGYTKYTGRHGLHPTETDWRHPQLEGRWDDMLVEFTPEFSPWFMTEDDVTGDWGPGWDGGFNHRWNTLLVKDFDAMKNERPPEIQDTYRSGRFLAHYRTSMAIDPPTIHEISVDAETASIDASGYERIEWVSQGDTVGRGSTIRYRENEDVEGYLRARITATRLTEASATLTQPITIRR